MVTYIDRSIERYAFIMTSFVDDIVTYFRREGKKSEEKKIGRKLRQVMGSAARKRNSKIFGERGRHPDIKVNDSFLLGLATKSQTKRKRLHVRKFIIL